MEKEEVSLENGRPLLSLSPPQKKKNCRCLTCMLLVSAVFVGYFCYIFYEVSSQGENKEDGLFSGLWVPNRSLPYYTNNTCSFIDLSYDCLKDGRPNTEYLYWRWQPFNSDLPPFDPERFMKVMQNKSWALIGDSILRNQMQSLICILSKIEEPVEIYHDAAHNSRTVHFPSHNFTIATIWAPYLVQADNVKVANVYADVHLDVLEKEWTDNYRYYDYVVIASGQWYLRSNIFWEKNKVIGCHACSDKNKRELGILEPYRKALRRTLSFITASDHKPLVFFRTRTPDHFEYGEWFNGGVCNRTEPYKDNFNVKPSDRSMRDVEVGEFHKAAAIAAKRGIQMELLDIFHLSFMRPDGHPGPYRTFPPIDEDITKKVQNDCHHWCLPGPIDTWNDLMMKIMLDSGAINSSSVEQKATR